MRRLKGIVIAILVFAFMLSPITVSAQNSRAVRVTVDGQEVIFQEHGPIIIDGHMYVPPHEVFEAMGFYVFLRPGARDIILLRDDIQGVLNMYNSIIWVSREPYFIYNNPYAILEPAILIVHLAAGELDPVTEHMLYPVVWELNQQSLLPIWPTPDVFPILQPMIPLRALVEILGGTAQWDGHSRTAILTSPSQ